MSNPRRTVASGLAPTSSTRVSGIDRLASEETSAPTARVVPHAHSMHGETRVDNYHWLRDRSDPEVLAYLDAENRYAALVMRHTTELQEQLYQEMRSRIQETDLSVPERRGEYVYYHRIVEGGQYPVYCRRSVSPQAGEEIVLDQNVLAAGHGYLRLGALEVSPDHRLVAYTVDTSGAEEFTLFIKDLKTGSLLGESIPRVSSGPAWANDSSTVFYCMLDGSRRPYRLYRHQVGTSQSEDVLVYVEPDASFYMEISRTRSAEYLLLDLSSHTTSEVWFTPADRPHEPFRLIQARQPGVEYSVTHHGESFFITTNDAAPNFRLVRTPVGRTTREHWSPVLPYRPEVKLDSTDAFRRHLVLYEREAGLRQIRIIDFASGAEHLIPFPEPVYTIRPHANPDFESTLLRFTYTSLVTPNSVVDYEMQDHTWTVRKLTQVRGGYDASQYRSERLLATAPDGATVPISLVYRLPFEPGTPRPLRLSGYGAYGLTYDPAI